MKLEKFNYFFNLYIPYLLIGGLYILVFEKGDVVLWINHLHNPVLDIFFQYFTYLGDGFFCVFLALILLFVRYYYALLCISSYIISGIPVRILKDFVFPNAPRPQLFFQNREELHLVEGLETHIFESFPSGHSTTAFSLFCIAALLTKDKKLQAGAFVIAFLVAFSRIYLVQHFFVDTYAGSIIGVSSAWVTLFLVNKYSGLHYSNAKLALPKLK
jgi:membrane-associated phospholipid phosphatase